MSVQHYLKLTAVVTVVIGLTLLMFPGYIAEWFMWQPPKGPGSFIFIQFLGSTLFGYSVLNYFASRHTDKTFLEPTLLGNFATLFVAFTISLVGVLNGSLRPTGWLIVLLHGTFAAGFARYLRQLPSIG